ncbi:MAG: hypothetical protein DHS20C18_44060 [Saprospiraceae bacterium]|nr:MAG: hypothetical protein DHS20C18_44060 [Saprospiraceae bacterium]
MSKPRISINKLGEYLQANPLRRKKIVSDAKNPQPYVVTRYADAREAIKDYFTKGFDTEILNSSIENHERKTISSDFQEQDQALSIELLEKVLDIGLPDFSDFTVSRYEGPNPKLNISGVDVSVNPDLIIRGTHRGQKVVGAIKLHISKGNQLDKEGAMNVATLLKEFVEGHVAEDDEKVHLSLCNSVDTFGQSMESAPKSFKRRMTHISSACEEIVLWWYQV